MGSMVKRTFDIPREGFQFERRTEWSGRGTAVEEIGHEMLADEDCQQNGHK